MKIFHIIPIIDSSGGAEKFVVQIASEMALSHDVTIVTFRDIPERSTYMKELNSKVHLISLGKKSGLNLKLIFKLFFLLRKTKPDIVNSHLPSVFPYLLLSILFLRKLTFVHVVHSLPRFEESRKWVVKVRTFLIKRRKFWTVVLSETSNAEMKEYYGVESSVVIKNGIVKPLITNANEKVREEIEKLKKNAETKVLLNIGRVDKIKNQQMLCEIIRKLNEKGKNTLLLIIGAPSFESLELFNQLKTSVPSNVHFLGLKSNVADYLSHTDVLCMTSLKEGLPLVVIEAMAYGIPVISTPAGGIPDVIENGRNGYVSENFEMDSYFEIISNFLTLSKSDINIISMNNINDFNQKYTIQLVAEQYLNFYNQLVVN